MEPRKKTVVLPVVALALLGLPAAAAAGESVVPPENSAATQYTEAIPTGGGQKDAGKTGDGEKRSPSAVLGPHKAHKLNAQGPQGHAAAEVAAATAPSPAPQSVAPAPAAKPPHGEAKSQGKPGSAGVPGDRPTSHHASNPPPEPTMSNGSSGVGEVLARATGSSSDGELGLLLPLLIVGTIAGAIFYLRRQRRPAA